MELDTSQKYAAAALFTLALHETQVTVKLTEGNQGSMRASCDPGITPVSLNLMACRKGARGTAREHDISLCCRSLHIIYMKEIVLF